MANVLKKINVTDGTSTKLQVIVGTDTDNFPIFKPIKQASLPGFPNNIILVEGSQLFTADKAVKGKESQGTAPDNRYFKIVLPAQEVYIRGVDLTNTEMVRGRSVARLVAFNAVPHLVQPDRFHAVTHS